MNFRIFILALATIAVGLVELIVGGILPDIAKDFNVSLSSAGQLITIFCLYLCNSRSCIINFHK
ncbi:hypothetical protein ACT7CZ_15400 [Bacillus cereus]